MGFSFGKLGAFNVLCISFLSFGGASFAQDTSFKYPLNPLDSNNGLFPSTSEYNRGYFNASNFDYPKEAPTATWKPRLLTQETAEKYMLDLKKHIEPDMRTLVENHEAWNAKQAGWYNIVWRGGVVPGKKGNPISGREVIMNSNTGQIVPSKSWKMEYRPTTKWMQNYGVIYYNDVAGYTLGQVFKNVYAPDPKKMQFLPGSIVVKIEAATVQPKDWLFTNLRPPFSVLDRAASWNVYRPTTEDQKAYRSEKDESKKPALINKVQKVYPFQLAIKVRDPIASPETGWVYLGYVYDASSQGETAWDRFVPAGLMWGNDPEYANTKEGEPPEGESLKETWVNPNAPPFVEDTLGWGGRFAAPMDVAVRHNVIFGFGALPDPPGEGSRVSSCLSCHSAAQYNTDPEKEGLADNIYPAPDPALPDDDDDVFYLYVPGTEQWARWFQNRPGTEPLSENAIALDYDLNSTLALAIFRAAKTGSSTFDDLMLGIFNGH